MKKKKLKPTSSYFLSQKLWRYLRRFLNREVWTYLYIKFQKVKIKKLLKLVKSEDLSLKKNLSYKKQKEKLNNKKYEYSFYLNKFNSSKPKGKYREYLDKFMEKINPITILEFGISEGAGLYSMDEYYKNSYFWGLDIDKNTFIKKKKFHLWIL